MLQLRERSSNTLRKTRHFSTDFQSKPYSAIFRSNNS